MRSSSKLRPQLHPANSLVLDRHIRIVFVISLVPADCISPVPGRPMEEDVVAQGVEEENMLIFDLCEATLTPLATGARCRVFVLCEFVAALFSVT
jgi:hypothetical protein